MITAFQVKVLSLIMDCRDEPGNDQDETHLVNRSGTMGKPRAAPSQRQLRVGELIRHELAEIFTRGEVVDPVIEKAGVTVTQVEMSPDLRVASSHVRPFGGGGDGAALVKALERHRRFIRGRLSPRLGLKFVPDLRFRLDTTADYAEHINRLLKDPHVARDLARGEDDE
jgi:ribosome-binding factor A